MRRAALTLTVLTVALLTPALAAADGDPASDYLLGQSVFLPFDAKIPAAKSRQLTQLVANSAHAGFRIKVAVISTRYDLGAITSLYLKPQKYAEFLGTEIRFVYAGRLLVVMPNGYGYSKTGRPQPSGPIASLPPPGPAASGLVSSAATAVQRLAAAQGVHLGLPRAGGSDRTTRDRIVIIAVALTAFALVGAWMLLRRLRKPQAT